MVSSPLKNGFLILCWVICLALQANERTLADVVRLLSDDSTALLHRLAAIDSASQEVLVSAYEVGDDDVALRLLAALRSASRRGVCVKLMVNGHAENNRMPKPLMQYLIGCGVQIREHLPDIRYRLDLGRQRMHDKLLVVDGQQLIIGGRNMRGDFYGASEMSYWDRELYLVGATAQHARQYYLHRWNAATSGVPDLNRSELPKVAKLQTHAELNEMPRSRALMCAEELLDSASVTHLGLRTPGCHDHSLECACEPRMSVECIRFLHDLPSGSKDDPAAIANQINETISQATSSILIETPYLVFTNELRHRLAEASRRGVAVCILTNSLETTDHVIVHAQYANERRWLRQQGIELWEMKGQRHLHAKAMVVDERLSMIGSYNFDVLSETRNSEVAVIIDDACFARSLTRQIGEHLQSSNPVPESGTLIGFDALTNEVESKVLREARIKRLIAPWIKKYL